MCSLQKRRYVAVASILRIVWYVARVHLELNVPNDVIYCAIENTSELPVIDDSPYSAHKYEVKWGTSWFKHVLIGLLITSHLSLCFIQSRLLLFRIPHEPSTALIGKFKHVLLSWNHQASSFIRCKPWNRASCFRYHEFPGCSAEQALFVHSLGDHFCLCLWSHSDLFPVKLAILTVVIPLWQKCNALSTRGGCWEKGLTTRHGCRIAQRSHWAISQWSNLPLLESRSLSSIREETSRPWCEFIQPGRSKSPTNDAENIFARHRLQLGPRIRSLATAVCDLRKKFRSRPILRTTAWDS